MSAPYATARKMLDDLACRRISALELLEQHVALQRSHHGKLNAVITEDLETARTAARALDDARVRGVELGVLAGLPMTIKDGFDVSGMPATAGNPEFSARERSCADADLVGRLRSAGAVIWGKTNVPLMLGDFQSYNAVFGTTNNPFDLSRTSGGSSGGAAAALAANITPLELGSDIGGSLRHPANFCGVCALKPSWGALPLKGHIPPSPGMNQEIDLNVAGPMARNVKDLKLMWDVLRGQPVTEPRPAAQARIAVWNAQPGWPLAQCVKDAVEQTAKCLSDLGFPVDYAVPDFNADALLQNYLDLLIATVATNFPAHLRDAMAARREEDIRLVSESRDVTGEARYRLRASATEEQLDAARRKRDNYKRVLDGFFRQGYDAILAPVTPVTAFLHDHSAPMNARTLSVDGIAAPYMSALNWISVATALHAPALVLPAARHAGLPIGVQLIGPQGGESRLFEVALAAELAIGPFPPPKL